MKAQEKIMISKPELAFANNRLTVRYDITGCGKGETVSVVMHAADSKGTVIKPVFIEGDLGKAVPCGLGKTIVWDIARDSIKIDEDISVEITGELNSLPVQVISGPAMLTRGRVLLSSAFVPGLGMKKASGKSSYFIFSGIVYGGAATAVYFSLESKKYKNRYESSSGTNEDFEKSDRFYKIATYTAVGTAGAWLVNMIWSAVIPIKDKGQKKASFYIAPDNNNKWAFGTRINF
ncbi:MAG: hypothetical protein U0T33_09335 [Bacteroidales bacterium]